MQNTQYTYTYIVILSTCKTLAPIQMITSLAKTSPLCQVLYHPLRLALKSHRDLEFEASVCGEQTPPAPPLITLVQ